MHVCMHACMHVGIEADEGVFVHLDELGRMHACMYACVHRGPLFVHLDELGRAAGAVVSTLLDETARELREHSA